MMTVEGWWKKTIMVQYVLCHKKPIGEWQYIEHGHTIEARDLKSVIALLTTVTIWNIWTIYFSPLFFVKLLMHCQID